ncbi:hypothetical protein JCM17845_06150 [Iodidimonas gelatinilytica]|uniref:Cbb3-type cytochrome oxidase assembly protein CcoS n=1 Tax=Iodidimonas gelatinilytica TaxID=1236966 RepID=A0A5A7MVN6_9PROT|nr:hypothetical protein JCM17845_06150 [Iodidimonas gelatinilytica]
MTVLLFLIPIALFLGGLGLLAFLWALKSGQYDDLDGAAERILLDDDADDENQNDEAMPRLLRDADDDACAFPLSSLCCAAVVPVSDRGPKGNTVKAVAVPATVSG